MGFGVKLAVFLTAALMAILGGAGFATYQSIRETLIDDGKAQITTAAGRFIRQLNEIEQQVASGVAILTLDFPLRQAVAQHDRAAVVSALRNHGRRVGASRMLLVETDGTVSADTSAEGSAAFPYPELLGRAADEGRAASVAVIDDSADWLVIVPVLAPDPIAYVAALVPLDDRMLARIRSLTGLPETMGLAVTMANGDWRVAAGPIQPDLMRLMPGSTALPTTPVIGSIALGEQIFLAASLATPPASPVVAVMFFYPLSEALRRRYERLILVLVVGIASGLIAAVVGAWLIARGVARPLELLAGYARRIGAGDYTFPPPMVRKDEIGQLSASLGAMARGIADREQHIRHQASHDAVTDLPNRQALMREIEVHCAGGSVAIIVIVLTRLQEIANTVGRDIANRMMADTAARLVRLLRAAPVGCIGERSFAAVLAGCDAAEARMFAHRVVEVFEQSYQEGDLTIDASVAIGLALSPEHGASAELLLRRAEVAAHAALHSEDHTAIYDAESDPHRPARLSLMNDLRKGLQRGELELLYQAKLDLRSGGIMGAEALVRWQHPEQGLIPSDAFIGLAEETGNIQHLTRWVLETGLAQAAAWRDAGLALRISINLSVRDLADTTLPERVAGLLRRHALPGETLVLEVTEGVIMRDPAAAIAVLQRLASQGITIAVDDFGVGQSSLTYLRRLPVGELKIDKDFVLQLPHSPDDQTIVRSVIELGHNLGFQVTAEGVQDAASVALLTQFGCDHAQGYYIARAVPADAFADFVAAWPERGELAAAAL